MNKLVVYILFLSLVFCQWSFAQELIPKKQTLSAMQKANQYFMDKWPDTGKPGSGNKFQ